jgi:hypothetical protein
MVSVLTGAMKEARAGYCDARTAVDTLAGLFLNAPYAVARCPVASKVLHAPTVRLGPNARHPRVGRAQAEAADLDAVRQRVEARCRRRGPRLPWQDLHVEPITLTEAHRVFRRWLGEDYDKDALDVVLAAAAVEQLDVTRCGAAGVRLGQRKDRDGAGLDGIGATITSTIVPPARCFRPRRGGSAASEPRGLLRKLGDRGVLVIKDVTSCCR